MQIGEGSDELFHGYQSYISARALPSALLGAVPARPAPAAPTGRPRGHRASRDASAAAFRMRRRSRTRQPDGCRSGAARSRTRASSRSACCRTGAAIPTRTRSSSGSGDAERELPGADLLQKMTYLELKNRLAELLLMRVDKMTMANSVEARVPFLDHDLVEFALALPPEMKVRDGSGKYLLKKAVSGLLPQRDRRPPEAGLLGAGQRVVPRGARRAGAAGDPRARRSPSAACSTTTRSTSSGGRTARAAATGPSSSGTSTT